MAARGLEDGAYAGRLWVRAGRAECRWTGALTVSTAVRPARVLMEPIFFGAPVQSWSEVMMMVMVDFDASYASAFSIICSAFRFHLCYSATRPHKARGAQGQSTLPLSLDKLPREDPQSFL